MWNNYNPIVFMLWVYNKCLLNCNVGGGGLGVLLLSCKYCNVGGGGGGLGVLLLSCKYCTKKFNQNVNLKPAIACILVDKKFLQKKVATFCNFYKV